MHQINKRATGFTIIELMISMAFVGTLLMVITLLIMRVTSLYNTGVTIKEVNAVSRVVVREFQQTVMNSNVFALRYVDTSSTPVVNKMATSLEEMKVNETDFYQNSAGGRLCTGTYSYAWNSGRAVKSYNEGHGDKYQTKPVQFIRNGDGLGKNRLVRFVKVKDGQKHLCQTPVVSEGVDYRTFLPLGDVGAEYDSVFGNGNNNLVLYRFDVDTGIKSEGAVQGEGLKSGVPYYTFSMVLGTQAGDEVINAMDTGCYATPDATVNDNEYCAVNRINFVARSGAVGG